jgi:hypothetical protein
MECSDLIFMIRRNKKFNNSLGLKLNVITVRSGRSEFDLDENVGIDNILCVCKALFVSLRTMPPEFVKGGPIYPNECVFKSRTNYKLHIVII